MNTTSIIDKAERQKQVLAATCKVRDAYKDLVALDESVPVKLIDHAFDTISKLNRYIRGMQREAAKVDPKKGGKQ